MPVAPHAWAAGTSVALTRSAWFSTSISDQAGAPPGTLPVELPDSTGVPKGDDVVAFTEDQSGNSSKETLLFFTLPKATASSTITEFTVTATLDPAPTAPQAAAAKAPVMACLPTRDWPAGEAQDSSQQPTVDCSSGVGGVWHGSTVSFAIPKLAQSWVDDANLGVALVNDPKNKTLPFQAVFKGGKAIHATLAFQASPSKPSHPSHHHTTPPQSGSHHQANGGGGGGGGSGGGGSFSAPTPTVNLPSGGATTVNTSPESKSPVVAASGSAAQPRNAALGGTGKASTLPSAGFWTVAAALLILLVGAGAALSPRNAVAPTRASRSRLDRLLRDPERLASLTARSQP
ncbi:MAG: hypothetical protein JO214_01625 [Frankiaceae bacterium]|nr:hypothetical protein [Frankiaceae bacterium]